MSNVIHTIPKLMKIHFKMYFLGLLFFFFHSIQCTISTQTEIEKKNRLLNFMLPSVKYVAMLINSIENMYKIIAIFMKLLMLSTAVMGHFNKLNGNEIHKHINIYCAIFFPRVLPLCPSHTRTLTLTLTLSISLFLAYSFSPFQFFYIP